MHQHRLHVPSLRQRGVYALEWAIVFPVFFMLVYAIISYGLTFLVRESMQNAVEDGARAALRYQVSRGDRLMQARELVADRMAWLPAALRPAVESVTVEVCSAVDESICGVNMHCGAALAERCLVRVALVLPYADAPLAPPLLGLNALVPERLSVSASILADRGGF